MRSVIFDLDGTLADTSGDLLAAANACFEGLGLGPLLTRADAGTALRGGRMMLRLGFSRLDADYGEDAVDAEYPKLLEHYAQAIDHHTFMFPGAMAAVEALKAQGCAVAICTNKPVHLAEDLMQKLGHRDAFGALVGAQSLPVSKPDPAPYFEAVKRLGGDPKRSLLVGDSMTDEETARAAGVPSVSVAFSPDLDSRAQMQPDAWLDDYADLPAIVARLLD